MISKNVEMIGSLISAGAESKTPFLFAVDFELSEGMFLEFPEKQSEILYSVSGASNKPDFQTKKDNGGITPSPISPAERQELLIKHVIREKNIRIEDLCHYDRLFLINAMLDISDSPCFAIRHQPGNCPLFVAEKA